MFNIDGRLVRTSEFFKMFKNKTCTVFLSSTWNISTEGGLELEARGAGLRR